LFGENASLKAGEILSRFGCKKALIVCDPGVKAVGLVDPIEEAIKEQEIETLIFDQVIANPTVESIHKGSRIANANAIDAVVAIGGGSAIDTAKGIALLTSNDEPLSSYFIDADPPTKPNPKNCRLIHIATTSGTGAEISAGAIISNDEGIKKVLLDPAFFADQSITDPLLTLGLPKYVTATTGIDALSHALDGLFTPGRSVVGEMYNGLSIRLVWENLGTVVNVNPKDIEARGAMCIAASLPWYYDGTDWSHAPSHVFGNKFHIAHGHCCAWSIPAFVRWELPRRHKEGQLLASIMGLDPDSATLDNDVPEALERFIKSMGLQTAKEMGIDRDEFIDSVDDIMAEAPYYLLGPDDKPTPEELPDILEEMYDY
jgi:alcohol dehydrogenase